MKATNNRASDAELVVVEAENLTPRPPGASWDAAGALSWPGQLRGRRSARSAPGLATWS
jgi:hypothetical protein